jgi:hypothetical protein
MIIDFIKDTIQLMILIIVVGTLINLFLKRTLIGRLIFVICKDIHLSLKLCFRISRHTVRIIHKDAKRLNDLIYKQYKKYECNKQNNKKEKKIVNGNNVVDFNTAKKKHNK